MIRALRHAARHPGDGGDGETAAALEIRDVPDPDLADDGVLVAVEAAVLGAPEWWALAHPDVRRAQVTPGGAAVGRVARTGPAATHLRDRRVLVGPEQACGVCDVCRRGGVWACPDGDILGRTADGALASHVACRARWVCPLDGGLEVDGPLAALLAREAAWAYALYARGGVAPGQPVIVVGDGPVARFLVAIAAAHGTRPVVLATPRHASHDELLADARRAARQVDEALRGMGHGVAPRFVFETEADPAGRALALAVAGPCAQVTLLARAAVGDPDEAWPAAAAAAGNRSDHEMALARLVADGVGAVIAGGGAIASVPGAHPDLLPEIAALAATGELDLSGVARLVTPEAVTRAFPRGDRDLLVIDMAGLTAA